MDRWPTLREIVGVAVDPHYRLGGHRRDFLGGKPRREWLLPDHYRSRHLARRCSYHRQSIMVSEGPELYDKRGFGPL